MRLRNKLFLAVAGVQVLLYGALFIYIISTVGRTLSLTLVDNGIKTAKIEAATISRRAEATASTAESLRITIESLKRLGKTDREFLPALVRDILDRNSDFFSVWAFFAPNAWDGKDLALSRDPDFAPTGAFVPWAYREANDLSTAVLAGMAGDDDVEGYYGDFYQIAFLSGKPLFLEPYEEDFGDGRKIFMTTYATPILGEGGTPIGVVGIDLKLSFLSYLSSRTSRGDESSSVLLSGGGLFLANQTDPSLVGKSAGTVDDVEGTSTFSHVVESGRSDHYFVPGARGRDLRIFEAVRLPGDSKPWVYVVSTPEASVLRERDALLYGFGGIFVAALCVLLIAVFLIANRITSPVAKIQEAFHQLEEGKLGLKVPASGKDEVGLLARDFNLFSVRLSSLIESFGKAASELDSTGGELSVSAAKTTTAIGGIREKVELVRREISAQSLCAEQSSKAALDIGERIDELGVVIGRQAESISEASASIEKMVGNIQSITSSSESSAAEMRGLGQSSGAGKEKLEAVIAAVSDVAARSTDLLAANKVIADVAAKTNLLAMNAAIEAAHAGAVGSGFAVVAGEIRNLAENTQKQSKAIASRVADIKSAIDAARYSSTQAGAAFDDVLDRIRRVGRLENEAHQALLEQKNGSELVMTALAEMKDAAARVEKSGEVMDRSGVEVRMAMERLNAASFSVSDGAREIAVRVDAIEKNAAEERRLAAENRSLAATFREEVSRFSL